MLLLFLTSCGGFVLDLASLNSTSASTATRSAPTSLSYDTNLNIYVYNDANAGLTANITSNNPIVVGTVTGFSISPNLATNTGLTFSTTTGIISGKATLTSAATDYTVTASNAGGSKSTTINIRTSPGFIVNDTGDAADAAAGDNACATAGTVCTLRAAIGQINAMAGAAHVILVPAGTFSIGSTLTLTNNEEIIGASQSTTILDGANGFYPLFSITGGTTTTKLSYFTLQNISGDLVNISTAIPTTLDHITFQGVQFASGGSAVEAGALTNLTISNSLFLNNLGIETVSCLGTSCTVSNSAFRANQTTNGGGVPAGISIQAMTSIVTGCEFSNNIAAASWGGVVVMSLPAGATGLIENSTFYANEAPRMGAVFVYGTAGETATINNCTFINNVSYLTTQPAGYSSGNNVVTTVSNTILIGNTNQADGVENNCGTFTSVSAGHNISSTVSGDCGFLSAGDQNGISPIMGALQDNGGPTQTMAITNASPAYHAGDPSLCTATDQRGTSRLLPTTCDIGAYEAIP